MKLKLFAALFALTLDFSGTASVQEFTRLTFDQKPGDRIGFSHKFIDDAAHSVSLGQYFGSGPVILTMGYYECPMLCNLTLNGLVSSLQEIKADAANEPIVIFISVDPTETPALAAKKKSTYLRRFGRSRAANRWHFLTGNAAAIREVAKEIGFHYAYDKVNRQYAHPAGLVIVAPDGKITSYLFGVTYPPLALQNALSAASAGQIGKPQPALLMLCSKFMTLTGKYSMAVLALVRVLGLLTIVGVAALIFWNCKRPKRGTV